jgi:CAAD domains of cyanobacterial aminoacyl-tRNA synthetase
MKNNIIKDDREISLKAETFPIDSDDRAKSMEEHHLLRIATDDINLPPEPPEMNMKTEILPDSYNDPELTASNHNLPTEPTAMNTETLADIPNQTEPMMMADDPIIEPAEAGQSIQTELTTFVENATTTITELFNNNRQLFITLGWIVLAIFSVKIVFATLGIIDDIPLVTPIIKLVGLVTIVRFAWRYLIREQNRKELIEIIDRTKVEVLGDRQPLS